MVKQDFCYNAKQVILRVNVKELSRIKFFLACDGKPPQRSVTESNKVVKGEVGTHVMYPCPVGCKETMGVTM